MIVDCHTHVSLTTDDAEIGEQLAGTETVDACIVLAVPDGSSEEVNKRLAEYVARHSNKMVGFAVVNPPEDKIGIDSLQAIQENLRLDGLVLHCAACGFHPANSRAMRFYESAQELDLPVFFHNGDVDLNRDAVLDYAQPYLLDEIGRVFPELKIIIGDMGVPFVEQTLSMVAKHKNVYADLTIQPGKVWQTYNIVVAAHERRVMEKLLFGSGFPLGNAGDCIETLLGFNMLLADTNLPTVPRGHIRAIVERDTLGLLGIDRDKIKPRENKAPLCAPGKEED
ncbi:MAG: amidohydrolase family protein [Phycisphaerales bacterium]|nr:MAG: amidohydrolase family protein [Phycisphaerales bacterium]